MGARDRFVALRYLQACKAGVRLEKILCMQLENVCGQRTSWAGEEMWPGYKFSSLIGSLQSVFRNWARRLNNLGNKLGH
jgi:hypothetical protein